MARMRVYHLAKELGVDAATVRAILAEMGRPVKSPSSTIDAATAADVRARLERDRDSPTQP